MLGLDRMSSYLMSNIFINSSQPCRSKSRFAYLYPPPVSLRGLRIFLMTSNAILPHPEWGEYLELTVEWFEELTEFLGGNWRVVWGRVDVLNRQESWKAFL